LLTTSVYSQITVDPSHNFYSTVQGWYNRGIVNKIPPVRPYPTLDIKEILNTVLDCQDSTELDIELANSYLQELNSKPWNLDLKTEYTYDNKNYTSDYLLNIIPAVNGNQRRFAVLVAEILGKKKGLFEILGGVVGHDIGVEGLKTRIVVPTDRNVREVRNAEASGGFLPFLHHIGDDLGIVAAHVREMHNLIMRQRIKAELFHKRGGNRNCPAVHTGEIED